MKLRVFVGSSVEALPIAYAIQKNLRHQAEVTVWDQGLFQLSRSSLQSLVAALENFDFGVFVFSPDDLLTIRGEDHRAVRDNVLFELGLFIGELGQTRCFILAPEGEADLRFPTDLLGVEPAIYESGRSDGNWQAATGPACTDIRRELQLQGRRAAVEERAEGTSPVPESSEGASKKPEIKEPEEVVPIQDEISFDPWLVSMVEGRITEALTEIEATLAKEESPEKLFDLRLWRALIIFEQSAGKGEEEYRALIGQNPESPRPWEQLSSALLHGGFRERALAVAEEGLAALPQSRSLLVAKALSLDALQRAEEAELALEKEMDSSRMGDEDLFSQLSRLQVQHGKTVEALQTLERGLARFPFSIALLESKASLLLSSKDYAGSISVYRQLIKLEPNESSYYALMGTHCWLSIFTE